MSTTKKPVRKSVSVPAAVARRVQSIAKARRISVNRVLVDLIETGLAAKEGERRRFLAVADQLARSKDKAERTRLKEELARMTFGD